MQENETELILNVKAGISCAAELRVQEDGRDIAVLLLSAEHAYAIADLLQRHAWDSQNQESQHVRAGLPLSSYLSAPARLQ